LVREIVEPIEDPGQRPGPARERGVRGDVVHPLALEPEMPLGAAQPLEKLLARSCPHGPLLAEMRPGQPGRAHSTPVPSPPEGGPARGPYRPASARFSSRLRSRTTGQ